MRGINFKRFKLITPVEHRSFKSLEIRLFTFTHRQWGVKHKA